MGAPPLGWILHEAEQRDQGGVTVADEPLRRGPGVLGAAEVGDRLLQAERGASDATPGDDRSEQRAPYGAADQDQHDRSGDGRDQRPSGAFAAGGRPAWLQATAAAFAERGQLAGVDGAAERRASLRR